MYQGWTDDTAARHTLEFREPHVSSQDTESAPAPTPSTLEERFDVYLRKLAMLKQRGALRDVMEREMLLEFIRTNHTRINEFPLLATQQNSVINILCYRSASHHSQDFVKRYTSNFLHLLTQFSKAALSKDQALTESLRIQIQNTETILIKCLQGAVYAASLAHDNFEEVLIQSFGAEAIPVIDGITERQEFNDRYWREIIDAFVVKPVSEAYDALIAEEKYCLRKEQNLLILQFAMDDILARLPSTDQDIQKTRVQTKYEEIGNLQDSALRLKLVMELLLAENETFGSKVSRELKLTAATIVCMDAVSEQLLAKARERAGAGDSGLPDLELAQRQFIQEQAVAMAVGAVLTFDIIREDFGSAISALGVADPKALQEQMSTFRMAGLKNVLQSLLEGQFLGILRGRAADEGNKVLYRAARTRRALAAKVDGLASVGMSKIRKHKLFEQDKGSSPYLLFLPRVPKELRTVLEMLQPEPEFAQAVLRLWEDADYKVDILAVINIENLARTTTNLKGRLGEILGKFGITGSS